MVLLFVLSIIFLIAVWRSSRDATRHLGDEITRLEREIDFLRSQVTQLLRSTAAPAPATKTTQPEVPQAPPVAPSQPPKPVAPPAAKPVTAPSQPAQPASLPPSLPSFTKPAPEPARSFSLEERLGKNWLNKLGIAMVVIGLASFLAVKLQTMGPAGKILCGFAVSLLLLGGGVWLERKPTYRLFARAGIGGGWALAYFTTYAMYHVPAARLIPSLALDLVLMLLVAAGMVAHSLRYRSQTVTGLAFLLGFGTLLASHLEGSSETIVFSMAASAVLALGLIAVTTLHHWTLLEIAGLIAVYLSHFVWLTQVLPDNHASFAQFWPSTALILLYWLIFRIAYVLRMPLNQREENHSSLAAILNSAGVLWLLKCQSTHPEWAFWVLASLGAVELALAFWVRPRRRQAFQVLSTIAIVLVLSAVPFRFHGVSWPVLWLVQAHVLAICGLRLREPLFRRLGLIAGILAGAVLALRDIVPLAIARLEAPDPAHHASLTVALALAALLYWIHAEIYPRRWPQIATNPGDALALNITNWLGLSAAAAALWVALPSSWVPVGWLALVLLLGIAADYCSGELLALEADFLTASAIFAFFPCTLWNHSGWLGHRAPALIVVALLYTGMRRKTVLAGSPNYVPAAYSWTASLLLPFLAFDIFPDPWIAPALAVTAVTLFEAGRYLKTAFLRWQGYALAAIAFCKTFVDVVSIDRVGPAPADHFSLINSRLLEVLLFAAAGYWLMERSRNSGHCTRADRLIGLTCETLGTASIVLWFAFRFSPRYAPIPEADLWVTSIWAAMATTLLAFAWIMRRRAFLIQAIALAVATFVHGLLDHLAGSPAGFWHGTLFHLCIASLLLIAALPFAFRLRGPGLWSGATSQFPTSLASALEHPEQWFFFAPFALMVIALAARLSAGHTTIGWSLLGVATFLFALAVGERSYRVAGLALLLTSVAKIILIDIWTLTISERYTALIVLGLALLAVSFLYTRFSSAIRKYL
jgi:uncharacterized membrane protein